eukprot:2928828-Prymnesium_polylepis.1
MPRRCRRLAQPRKAAEATVSTVSGVQHRWACVGARGRERILGKTIHVRVLPKRGQKSRGE